MKFKQFDHAKRWYWIIWISGAVGFGLMLSNACAATSFSAELRLSNDPKYLRKADRFFRSARKEELKISKEPCYRSSVPQYYQLPFDDGKSTGLLTVVADEAANSEPLLYIDINRNGDLTDDGVFHWKPGEDGSMQMAVALPPSAATTGVWLNYTLTRLQWTRGAKSTTVLMFRPEYCRVGHLRIGNQQYAVAIHNIGEYGNVDSLSWGIDLDGDGTIEDSFISDEQFEGAEPFQVAGKSYAVSAISDSGDKITIKVSSQKANPKPRLRIGDLAPDITLQMLDGKSARLRHWRGRALLLEFWTTYCAPCISIVPDMKAFYGQWSRSQLEIVGISLDEAQGTKSAEALVRLFVAEHQIPWPVAIADKGMGSEIAHSFNLSGFPLSILLDKSGRIISIDVPNAGIGGTVRRVQALLGQEKAAKGSPLD
jgi:peroxiredoxin